jgi:hypothetical protein
MPITLEYKNRIGHRNYFWRCVPLVVVIQERNTFLMNRKYLLVQPASCGLFFIDE